MTTKFRAIEGTLVLINQHGWTKIFDVTAATKHENSLERQHFSGYFRINQHGWTKIFRPQAQPDKRRLRE